jgi:hypothetical protein
VILSRPLKRICILVIADNSDDLCIPDDAAFYAVNDRLQIRTSSGYEHNDL